MVYEPVWAIDTDRTVSSEQAQAVHVFLWAHIAARGADVTQRLAILYGGGIKLDSASRLFVMADIDGGLIDGASLKIENFLATGRV